MPLRYCCLCPDHYSYCHLCITPCNFLVSWDANIYDHQFRSTPYTITILSNIVKYASVLSSTLSFISFNTLPTAVFLPHVWSCSFALCTLPHSPLCTPAPTVDGPHIIFMIYVRYMDASASPDSSSIIFPLYPLQDHVVMWIWMHSVQLSHHCHQM